MSIFKKDGRWVGTVELPKGKDGKRRKKFFYGNPDESDKKQKSDINSRMNALIYEIENNLYASESNASLEEYLKEWFKIYTVDLQETTRQLYKIYMDKHIIPHLGDLKIKKIMPMQLQEFYNLKAQTLSGKSVAKLHNFLNRVLKDAYKNRLIKYNPCDGVDKPKPKKFIPTIYTQEEFNKLMLLVEGTFDEVCILLAGVCGLRRGEIFGLRLRDIDFKECKISIVETMVRMNGDWLIKDPKSETSRRRLKVPSFVTKVINDYLIGVKVVPERICGQYKPSSYSQHFKKLLEDNGLPHIRLHDLRHFNATMMMKYDIPDTVASGRLGHSQVQMTRYYQHSSSDMDNEASNALENIFKKAGT